MSRQTLKVTVAVFSLISSGSFLTLSTGLLTSEASATVQGSPIINSTNHLCTALQSSGKAGAVVVEQATCLTSLASQNFIFLLQGNGYLLLQNAASNNCVATSGSLLIAATCNAQDTTQQFFASYQGSSGQFALLNRKSGLCVGNASGSGVVGVQLSVLDCAANLPQVYTISALSAPGPNPMPVYSKTGVGRAASVPGNPSGTFTTIISGKTFNGDVYLYNVTNTLFIGNTIIGGALKIDNAKNVYIKNNTLVDSEIWFRDYSLSNNIVIDGNEVFGAPSDCMLLDEASTTVNPTNISVVNNEFHDCGTRYPGSGLYHGIYDQVPGVLFENNLFYHNKDDISIRSSGIIRRNVFKDDVLGASILYMADHPAPTGSTLLVENNILTGEITNGEGGSAADHRALVQFTPASQAPIANYVVRFNTMVVENQVNDGTGIYWDIVNQVPFSSTTTRGQFYGNILVNLLNTNYLGYLPSTYASSNVETQFLTGLDFTGSLYNLGGAGSSAAGFANTEDNYPSTDRDLNPRPSAAGNIDAGAQQLQ
jgi:pectate lyase